MKLSPGDAELLGLIASVCPSRTWYPENRECMQKVEWLDLPANSQHPELYVAAKAIKEHCERVLLFHGSEPNNLLENFPSRDDSLLNRSALRTAYLFPPEAPPLSSRTNFDVRYNGRDLKSEHRAYTAATIVQHRVASEATAKGIERMTNSWVDQAVFAKEPLSFQYDRSWVEPNLPLIWLEAYNQLRRHSDEGIWNQSLFSLPAMAYASQKFSGLVPAFVAFALEPHFVAEDPPPMILPIASQRDIFPLRTPCPEQGNSRFLPFEGRILREAKEFPSKLSCSGWDSAE